MERLQAPRAHRRDRRERPARVLTSVALVHDYFVVPGGAERVAGHLHETFPDAPVYTSAVGTSALPPSLRDADIRVSYLQNAPGIGRAYRAYLPLYAHAFGRFSFDSYDLVIASSSAWAHTVRVPGRLVVYCHTPPRFLWQTDDYLRHEHALGRSLVRRALSPSLEQLRRRDRGAAQRATAYVANSRAVAERIGRFYGRTATVVHPPIETERFSPREQKTFVLVVSRLQAYKRIDLAIRACEELGLPLLVVGDGPARRTLKRQAGKMTRFLGRLDDAHVSELLGSARALIFPGDEDFGLVPLEASASGCPVVAFARGGALETVRDGETGVLFHAQTVDSVKNAVELALARAWDRDALRIHAETFGVRRFQDEIRAVCRRVLAGPPVPA